MKKTFLQFDGYELAGFQTTICTKVILSKCQILIVYKYFCNHTP
jgi:hypothetical protein